MSELNSRYKQILQEIEENIQDENELKFVKEKFADLSMLFIDIIDRLTELTDSKMKAIEQKQQEISSRMNQVQTIVDGIESDIYEDEENYEFEIVCPYCNHEFTTDIEDTKDEIQCPECHNTIELDWNSETEESGCGSNCSQCLSQCNVAEEQEEYIIEDNKKKNDKNKDDDNNNEDEDM